MKHLVIPDTQVKPGVPIDHFKAIGKYIREKRPDVIIHLGDWYDMPSLCEYDRSERPGEFYSRSFQKDLDAGDKTVDILENEIGKAKRYNPKKLYLMGNHEERFDRMIHADPRLATGDLRHPTEHAMQAGWDVYDFLVPANVDGVLYCHYFCRGPNGTVMNAKRGAPSAKAQVMREMQSCTAGHKQGLDGHIQPTAKGMIRGIIAGSCYQHDEDYLSPQGTQYWRGILVKHEVEDGNYNLLEVSLAYLKSKYS